MLCMFYQVSLLLTMTLLLHCLSRSFYELLLVTYWIVFYLKLFGMFQAYHVIISFYFLYVLHFAQPISFQKTFSILILINP
jgi:hypothetical protein